MKLFTIGYGGRSPEEFTGLLVKNGIKTVVDVRLRPDSASMGIYAKAKSSDKGIQKFLTQNNIQYFSFIELGNPFMNHDNWKEKYSSLINNAGDVLFEEFFKNIPTMPSDICLLCAEKNASECHRSIVAACLEKKGFEIEHIV